MDSLLALHRIMVHQHKLPQLHLIAHLQMVTQHLVLTETETDMLHLLNPRPNMVHQAMVGFIVNSLGVISKLCSI